MVQCGPVWSGAVRCGDQSDQWLLIGYYQIARNKAVKAVRNAKLKFEKKLAKLVKGDPKSFFVYARSKSKTKDIVGPLNDNNDNIATDNDEICEILNTFFVLCLRTKMKI